MSYEVKIITDSISPAQKRLTSIFAKYPKFIHGEAKTHRKLRAGTAAYEFLEEVGFMDDPALSRNASSSRAIPVERMIADILADPVVPVYWGKAQRGMQADEEVDEETKAHLLKIWFQAMHDAINAARVMNRLGAHKQIINRILEPYMHIRVLVTATDWNNFFALRCHPEAQPEMRHLACLMRDALAASNPQLLRPGEWHLPYVSGEEISEFGNLVCRKLSVARCARVSYLTHEGKRPMPSEDMALFNRLVDGDVVHASPTEHQATPDGYSGVTEDGKTTFWSNPEQHANFTGWRQFRKMIPGESVAG
jgi:hypothetical protein